MTTSDAANPPLYRAVKGSRAGSIEPVACALTVEPTGGLPVATVRLSWSPLMAARLRGLAGLATETGEPEGRSLPYASLRTALQAQIPEAVLLARDLGAPWKREEGFPFLDAAAVPDGARDPLVLAASALRTWMTMVLRPWAERLGIDEDMVEAVHALATPEGAFTAQALDVDLGERLRERGGFDQVKHGILQVIARRLEGHELFDGLGPVHRVVRGSSSANEVSFQTWPATASSGGRYSMVATLAVESRPYLAAPVVTVNASRRRWYDAIPEPRKLRRLRSVTGTVMGRAGAPVAVEFTTPVRRGVPEEPFSPAFMIHALNVRQDLAVDLAGMVAGQGAGGVFVGIPYSPQLGGSHPVGGGATTRDLLDLLDAVRGLLAADGFRLLPFRETEVNKRAPKRAEDQHKALQAEAMIADVALSLGRNHLDGESLEDACRRLMTGGEVPDLKPEAALKARSALEEVRAANRDRIRRAFGGERPVVALIARTEREREVMRSCVAGLFGHAVEIAEHQLPAGVHGARADLPMAAGRAAERFAARVGAWQTLASEMASAHGGCHALVQAADWYDQRKDDPVNKLAGRYALASGADANVQYLRPPGAGWRGLANYLHRIQSGVYDLLFGHSGLVSEVSSLLKGAFPNEADRPGAIVGISVVTQARLRYGAGGGRVCLATRIDAATGRTTARVGWYDGRMLWTETWEPFFEAMKRIASPEVTASLGDGRNVERDSFQKFVQTVIDDSTAAGDRPLVLVDSTSAASLWPWLTDREIGEAITLGGERVDMASRWPGTRIVRVRTGRAGRVVERKTSRYERVDDATGEATGEFVDRYCPSITARTIRLPDASARRGAHYWITSGYFQMSIPRGLSVYRNLHSFFPAKKEKGLALPPGMSAAGLFTRHVFDIAKAPYRLPNPIDVTVAVCGEGDDPDRIAHLVASLRYGYGHTGATTTLPAPLSFESKARDYMTRFALDEADAEDALDEGDGDAPDEGGGGEPDAATPEPPEIEEAAEPSEDVADDTGGPETEGGGPERGEPRAAIFPGALPLSPGQRPDAVMDRWDELLASFGVRTAADSLMGSTSLRGSTSAIAFGGAGGAPVGRAQSEQHETEDEGMSTNGRTGQAWVAKVREPVLPIPPFVTREWLVPKISVPNMALREIHRWRDEIRAISGFPWPEERPTQESFPDLMLDGLRYPGFVRAVTRAAIRHVRNPNKQTDYSLFGPFRKQVSGLLTTLSKRLRQPYPSTLGTSIPMMIAAGKADVAIAHIFIKCHGHGYFEKLHTLVDDHADVLLDVALFLDVAKDHLAATEFSWKNEIVDQRGVVPLPFSLDDTTVSTNATMDNPLMDACDGDAPDSGMPPSAEVPTAPSEGTSTTPAPEETGDAPSFHEQEGMEANDMAEEPDPDTPELTPMEAAREAWEKALRDAARLAATAADGEPDGGALETLSLLLDQARAAASDWDDAKPKLVDVTPVIEEMSAMAATLVDIADTVEVGPVDIPSVTLVPEEAAKAAENILAEAREAAAGAAQERDLTVTLMGNYKRLEEAMASKARGRTLALAGLEALRRAAASLAEGEASPAAALPTDAPAPEPAGVPSDADAAVTPQPATVPPETAEPTTLMPSAPPTGADSLAAVEDTDVPASVETLDAGDAPAPEMPATQPGAAQPDAALGSEFDAAMELAAELAAEQGDGAADDAAGGPATVLEETDAVAEAAFANVPEDLDAGFEDPLAVSIRGKLRILFAEQEFGLAYHLLLAAERVFPGYGFGFSVAELRLAAVAGHINHATMQGNPAFLDLLAAVLVSAGTVRPGAADVPNEVAVARRIVLFGATAAMALFHPGSAAVKILEAVNGVAPGLEEHLYPLRDALAEAERSGLGLTPAILRAVSRAAENDRYGDECLAAALEKIDHIAGLHFRFTLGNRIRAALVHGGGLLGILKERLGGGDREAIEAARDFAATYAERSAVILLFDETEATFHSRIQGIDGDARERLLANIQDLAARCAEFVQAREAAPAMRSPGHRKLVEGIRNALLSALTQAQAAISEATDSEDPLIAAAASFATKMLAQFRLAVNGDAPVPGTIDHLLALHGPLLWLPGLRYGRSWLPSPYQPEILASAILAAPVPLFPPRGERTAALERAVRERLDENSFVAASLLVECGAFLGVPEGERGRLREIVEVDVQTRRDQMESRVAEARRKVDRVQRMDMFANADDAQEMLSLLDRIEIDELPAAAAVDSRPEVEEGEVISDFSSAQAVLDDVLDRAERLAAARRGNLLKRVDEMAAAGRVGGETAERIRGIIGKDDLMTAQEYLDFLEDGRELPTIASPNPRFRAFFPAVPNALARWAGWDLESAEDCIAQGRDFDSLPFSRIPDERREDALEILAQWRNLRSRVQAGNLTDNVTSLLHSFLERIGLTVSLKATESKLTKLSRKVYVTAMQMSIPADRESVLLPDFGSQTGGNYRVCIVAKMPTEAELTGLCDSTDVMGVIVFVAAPVDAERRRQLAANSIKLGRKVLVIDEAILLFALSEPEFRPLTIFECAQPFSFAAPYRDYGNQAVPREMFFGRETEYRKLVEPSGSCIVYGGRRLGKTALLQHIKATKHDPARGMAVGYANILDIGNNTLPARIWEYASRELPTVFREPVSTAADFAAGAMAWLEADTRRRILLLLDEADRFIETDARDNGFREFIRLQQLMDNSNRRFKFVLAGLHNVTRLVHTENPPLKQIASDPQRIGPLMHEEFKDAELLVTRPFAAMGYEFANREDVWRILSHCNYYPVLVQTFCKGLLEALTREVAQGSRPIATITGEHVRAALENERIAHEIGEMFDYTISKIEDRYALIANIIADHALKDIAAGRVGEGMTAVEVMDAVSNYWPSAFQHVNRLSTVEDLLDEMEGLGVLRRVGKDTWALRSRTILRLLGNDDKVLAKLVEFLDRPAPAVFEPRSMRRSLTQSDVLKIPAGHTCPLTLGQEHDLLTLEAPSPTAALVRVIFGNDLSDVLMVGAAMTTAGPLVSDGTKVEVVARVWANSADLREAIGRVRPKEGESVLFVADARTAWDFDWIEPVLRSQAVSGPNGRVRVAFVGGPKRALHWVSDDKTRSLHPQVRVMTLQPWSSAMVAHSLNHANLPTEQYADLLRRQTGGFNRPMTHLIGTAAGPRDRFQNRIEKHHEKLLADPGTVAELGLVEPMREIFLRIPDWLDPDGRITASDIGAVILPEIPAAASFTGQQVVEFGVLMGLLEGDALDHSTDEDGRRYALNPFLAAALAAARATEVAR
ncbi:RNaseH domain-containing protein [Azospirillum argentinense]|uniref:RNaseH domain-containing protein n=1 Tax=Azospirillum argentinense TaxID=2970906 RepID=A0ABW8VDI2_9PROT